MIRTLSGSLAAAVTDRRGVSAMEYALLMTGIIIGVSTAVAVLQPGLALIFGTLATKLPT